MASADDVLTDLPMRKSYAQTIKKAFDPFHGLHRSLVLTA